MKILDLSLTYHWYDEIAAGNKPEEYRQDKPFYKSRFMTGYNHKECNSKKCMFCKLRISNICKPKEYDAVRLHRGQGSKTSMLVKWKGLIMGYGYLDWGAPKEEYVFITLLGRTLTETSGAPFLSSE